MLIFDELKKIFFYTASVRLHQGRKKVVHVRPTLKYISY